VSKEEVSNKEESAEELKKKVKQYEKEEKEERKRRVCKNCVHSVTAGWGYTYCFKTRKLVTRPFSPDINIRKANLAEKCPFFKLRRRDVIRKQYVAKKYELLEIADALASLIRIRPAVMYDPEVVEIVNGIQAFIEMYRKLEEQEKKKK